MDQQQHIKHSDRCARSFSTTAQRATWHSPSWKKYPRSLQLFPFRWHRQRFVDRQAHERVHGLVHVHLSVHANVHVRGRSRLCVAAWSRRCHCNDCVRAAGVSRRRLGRARRRGATRHCRRCHRVTQWGRGHCADAWAAARSALSSRVSGAAVPSRAPPRPLGRGLCMRHDDTCRVATQLQRRVCTRGGGGCGGVLAVNCLEHLRGRCCTSAALGCWVVGTSAVVPRVTSRGVDVPCSLTAPRAPRGLLCSRAVK
jgi:hypothetical protein